MPAPTLDANGFLVRDYTGGRQEFTAKLQGKTIQVSYGMDGCLWTWTNEGQVAVAAGSSVLKWIEKNVVARDRERCKQSYIEKNGVVPNGR